MDSPEQEFRNWFFGSVSEYPKPPHIRDDDKDTHQNYQDLVRAPLADTPQGRVAVLAIRRFTYPAGFWLPVMLVLFDVLV